MYHIPAELNSSPTCLARTTWLGVEFIHAKVGHGKTHHVVKERIIPALKEGRHVFTNIDFGGPLVVGTTDVLTSEERAGLLFSHYLKKDIRHLFHSINGDWVKSHLVMNENQKDFTVIPPGSRVILDEVQDIFSRDGYMTAPKGFFRFLCKCRHYDVDFVFISQNPALVDGRIVSTSSKIIRIKNGGFMSSIFSKNYRITLHQSLSDWEGYGSSVHKFDDDIFLLYKSSNSIVKHQFTMLPSFMLIPLVCIGLWAVYMGVKLPSVSFWGKKHTSIPVSSKSVLLPSPLPIYNGESLPAQSPTPVTERVIKQLAVLLHSDTDIRDSVSSSTLSYTRTFDNVYVPSKVYKSHYVHGVETFDLTTL